MRAVMSAFVKVFERRPPTAELAAPSVISRHPKTFTKADIASSSSAATLKDGAQSTRTLAGTTVLSFAQFAFRSSPSRVSHAPPVLQPEGVPCWLVDEC